MKNNFDAFQQYASWSIFNLFLEWYEYVKLIRYDHEPEKSVCRLLPLAFHMKNVW